MPRLTVQDVPEALSTEQVLQSCHLVLKLPHQFRVGVLIDDGVALDLLGSVRISLNEQTKTVIQTAIDITRVFLSRARKPS